MFSRGMGGLRDIWDIPDIRDIWAGKVDRESGKKVIREAWQIETTAQTQ